MAFSFDIDMARMMAELSDAAYGRKGIHAEDAVGAVNAKFPDHPRWVYLGAAELGFDESFDSQGYFDSFNFLDLIFQPTLTRLHGTGQAFVAVTPDSDADQKMVISFRGTEDKYTLDGILDWIGNVWDKKPQSQIILFEKLLEACFQYARETGIEEVYLTGHSLGGSVAEAAQRKYEPSLESDGIKLESYVFGSPGLVFEPFYFNDNVKSFAHTDDIVANFDGLLTSAVRKKIQIPPLQIFENSEHSMNEYIKSLDLISESLLYEYVQDQHSIIRFPDDLPYFKAEKISFVLGSAERNIIDGSAERDLLDGGDGDDTLSGQGGNDLIAGGAGNDLLIGGEGVDTALFLGRKESFTFAREGELTLVVGEETGEGHDRLHSIEWLQFAESGERMRVADLDTFEVIDPTDPDPKPEPPPLPDPETNVGASSLLSVRAENISLNPGESVPLLELFPLAGWQDTDGPYDIVAFAVQDRTAGGGFLTDRGERVNDQELNELPIVDIHNWRFHAAPEGPEDVEDEIGFTIIQSDGVFSRRLDPGAIVTSVAAGPSIPPPNPDPDPGDATTGGSNLVAISFGANSSGASPQGDVEITYTVMNIGDERSARGEAEVILSRSSDLQSTRLVGDEYNIPELDPGEARTYTRTTQLPVSGNGSYYLGIDVRSISLGHNRIEEDDTASIPFEIQPGLSGDPDLRVTDLDVVETAVGPAETFDVSFEITTNSNGSPPYSYDILVSQDEIPSTDDVVLLSATSDRGLGSHGISYLSHTLSVPGSVADGIYNLIIRVDPDNRIVERRENNNYRQEEIVVADRLPDGNSLVNLVGSHIELETNSIAAGDRYNFKPFFYRDSLDDPFVFPSGSSNLNTVIGLYLSDDRVFDQSDILLYSTLDLIGDSLQAVIATSFTITFPSFMDSGNYYLIAKVDPFDEIAEDLENDNTTSPMPVSIVNAQSRTVSAEDDEILVTTNSVFSTNLLQNDTSTLSQDVIVLYFEDQQVPSNEPLTGRTASGVGYTVHRDGTLELNTSDLLQDPESDDVLWGTFRYRAHGLSDSNSDIGSVVARIVDPSSPLLSSVTGDLQAAITEDDTSVTGSIGIETPQGPSSAFADAAVRGNYGLLEVNATGDQWIYTPDLHLQYLSGDDEIRDVLRLESSTGILQDIEITIVGIDDPAILIGPETIWLSQDEQAASGQMSLLDIDQGEDPVLNPLFQSGSYGRFEISTEGDWTYQRNGIDLRHLSASEAVGDSFTLTASDGSQHQITISIVGADDLPVIDGDFERSLFENETHVTGAIGINDPDAEDNPSFAGTTAHGTYGTLTVNGAGNQWRYDRNAVPVDHLEQDEELIDTFVLGASDETQVAFNIKIIGISEEPPENNAPVGLALDSNTIPENPATGSLIGELTAIDLDIGDSHTFQIVSGSGSPHFEVSGNRLQVSPDADIDYEVSTSFDLLIRTTDSGGLSAEQSINIQVTNRPITDIVLQSGGTVRETAAEGTDVASFEAFENPVEHSATFNLIDDAAGRFTIVGNDLRVAPGAIFDAEASGSHTVRISATDGNSPAYQEDFVIQVLNDSEPAGPDLSAANLSVDSANWLAGDTVNVEWSKFNLGDTSAPATRSSLYLSNDPAVSTDDILLMTIAGQSIEAGAADLTTGIFDVPASLPPGDYYIAAIADDDGVLIESNEGNNSSNVLPVSISEVAVPSIYDIAIGGGGTGLESFVRGNSYITLAALHNFGPNTFEGDFQYSVFLSRDKAYSADDIVLNEHIFAGPISAQANSSVTTSLLGYTIPEDTPLEDFYLGHIALVDGDPNSGNNITWIRNGSNTELFAIEVALPDMQPDASLLDLSNDSLSWNLIASPAGSTLQGNVQSTFFQGLEGNDEIFAGGGHDTLLGGVGNDRLRGGAGNDFLVGGPGADIFIFEPNGGHDIVEDFQDGFDQLDLTAFKLEVAQAAISNAKAGSVVLSFPDGSTITLRGIDLSEFSDDDVILPNLNGPVIPGSHGWDILNGTPQGDIFVESRGSDVIDGGSGIDTMLYDGTRSNYSLELRDDGLVWVQKPGGDTDALINIERVSMIDGDHIYNIDTPNLGFGYRIYQASFDRTPDEGGVLFWIGVLDDLDNQGWSQYDKEQFLASQFIQSDEFKDLFGANPTNEEYIDAMYQNVLDRLPDQGGYDFWVGGMVNDGLTREDILIAFTKSDENVDRTAPDLDDGVWVV